MKIGNTVTSKKMGPPVVGRVMGIMNAPYFFSSMNIDPHRYYKHYPSMKNICIVMFNQPILPHSKDMYNQHIFPEISYQLQQPTTTGVYPEDDLEIMDDTEFEFMKPNEIRPNFFNQFGFQNPEENENEDSEE